MKERPILFSGSMIRAILDGRKTQTRRVIKEVPTFKHIDRPIMDWGLSGCHTDDDGRYWLEVQTEVDDSSVSELLCHHGQPGDRLWVKETHWRFGIWRKNGLTSAGRQKWRFVALRHDLGVQFSAPAPTPTRGRKGWHKRPSIFMPRPDSRITLEVVSVRVESLQDISEDDAKAEGIRDLSQPFGTNLGFGVEEPFSEHGTSRQAFRGLWDSINSKRVYGWDVNPWVWVIGFRRLAK